MTLPEHPHQPPRPEAFQDAEPVSLVDLHNAWIDFSTARTNASYVEHVHSMSTHPEFSGRFREGKFIVRPDKLVDVPSLDVVTAAQEAQTDAAQTLERLLGTDDTKLAVAAGNLVGKLSLFEQKPLTALDADRDPTKRSVNSEPLSIYHQYESVPVPRFIAAAQLLADRTKKSLLVYPGMYANFSRVINPGDDAAFTLDPLPDDIKTMLHCQQNPAYDSDLMKRSFSDDAIAKAYGIDLAELQTLKESYGLDRDVESNGVDIGAWPSTFFASILLGIPKEDVEKQASFVVHRADYEAGKPYAHIHPVEVVNLVAYAREKHKEWYLPPPPVGKAIDQQEIVERLVTRAEVVAGADSAKLVRDALQSYLTQRKTTDKPSS